MQKTPDYELQTVNCAILTATADLGGFLIRVNNPINEGGAVMAKADLIQAASFLQSLIVKL